MAYILKITLYQTAIAQCGRWRVLTLAAPSIFSEMRLSSLKEANSNSPGKITNRSGCLDRWRTLKKKKKLQNGHFPHLKKNSRKGRMNIIAFISITENREH